MLEIRNIFKTYDNKPLLRGISFSVSKGETVCLLGASGSGKSTLLRMIAGLEFSESGHILFNKIDLAQTPPHLRDFGLVFQDYGLFPHLNIFDNIAFGLKMRNVSTEKINVRVSEMLDLVNLQGFEKRKVTDLSGGEQQRVALARALAPSPRLLMFDEPLGALDKSLKEDLLNQIRAILHQTKIPAIYVTHDQDEAFTIADRILFLHDGEIIRDGAPDEVWKNPNSAWVARMLGVGSIAEGRIQNAEGRVQNAETSFGTFNIECGHKHSAGDNVSLLIRQSGEGQEIQLTVEDVLFKRDQFEVKARGGLVIHLKDAPKIGETIRVKVQVECLA
jgi:ABC-type Fe3+/spermidine/putrescine transport system ATPase subunit